MAGTQRRLSRGHEADSRLVVVTHCVHGYVWSHAYADQSTRAVLGHGRRALAHFYRRFKVLDHERIGRVRVYAPGDELLWDSVEDWT